MLTDTLQRAEILHARHAVEPLVEERLGVRKDDLPIGVVLDLLIGLVADPYRPHAAIAVDRRFLPFDQRGFAAHSIDRLETRSEEHTSELQSLMRISYAVFCLNKTKKENKKRLTTHTTYSNTP